MRRSSNWLGYFLVAPLFLEPSIIFLQQDFNWHFFYLSSLARRSEAGGEKNTNQQQYVPSFYAPLRLSRGHRILRTENNVKHELEHQLGPRSQGVTKQEQQECSGAASRTGSTPASKNGSSPAGVPSPPKPKRKPSKDSVSFAANLVEEEIRFKSGEDELYDGDNFYGSSEDYYHNDGELQRRGSSKDSCGSSGGESCYDYRKPPRPPRPPRTILSMCKTRRYERGLMGRQPSSSREGSPVVVGYNSCSERTSADYEQPEQCTGSAEGTKGRSDAKAHARGAIAGLARPGLPRSSKSCSTEEDFSPKITARTAAVYDCLTAAGAVVELRTTSSAPSLDLQQSNFISESPRIITAASRTRQSRETSPAAQRHHHQPSALPPPAKPAPPTRPRRSSSVQALLQSRSVVTCPSVLEGMRGNASQESSQGSKKQQLLIAGASPPSRVGNNKLKQSKALPLDQLSLAAASLSPLIASPGRVTSRTSGGGSKDKTGTGVGTSPSVVLSSTSHTSCTSSGVVPQPATNPGSKEEKGTTICDHGGGDPDPVSTAAGDPGSSSLNAPSTTSAQQPHKCRFTGHRPRPVCTGVPISPVVGCTTSYLGGPAAAAQLTQLPQPAQLNGRANPIPSYIGSAETPSPTFLRPSSSPTRGSPKSRGGKMKCDKGERNAFMMLDGEEGTPTSCINYYGNKQPEPAPRPGTALVVSPVGNPGPHNSSLVEQQALQQFGYNSQNGGSKHMIRAIPSKPGAALGQITHDPQYPSNVVFDQHHSSTTASSSSCATPAAPPGGGPPTPPSTRGMKSSSLFPLSFAPVNMVQHLVAQCTGSGSSPTAAARYREQQRTAFPALEEGNFPLSSPSAAHALAHAQLCGAAQNQHHQPPQPPLRGMSLTVPSPPSPAAITRRGSSVENQSGGQNKSGSSSPGPSTGSPTRGPLSCGGGAKSSTSSNPQSPTFFPPGGNHASSPLCGPVVAVGSSPANGGRWTGTGCAREAASSSSPSGSGARSPGCTSGGRPLGFDSSSGCQAGATPFPNTPPWSRFSEH
ncbi:unnamed protein product [Amoebophrya sp. A120]|nr:unnamed protein product [Amoebophrya sp. A120]|eukprot:GSA120T00000830001.1